VVLNGKIDDPTVFKTEELLQKDAIKLAWKRSDEGWAPSRLS
jgi:hypothetical protein